MISQEVLEGLLAGMAEAYPDNEAESLILADYYEEQGAETDADACRNPPFSDTALGDGIGTIFSYGSSCGYGFSYGSSCGYGFGYGYGYGSGTDYGIGNGYGSGTDNGFGNGTGLGTSLI